MCSQVKPDTPVNESKETPRFIPLMQLLFSNCQKKVIRSRDYYSWMSPLCFGARIKLQSEKVHLKALLQSKRRHLFTVKHTSSVPTYAGKVLFKMREKGNISSLVFTVA